MKLLALTAINGTHIKLREEKIGNTKMFHVTHFQPAKETEDHSKCVNLTECKEEAKESFRKTCEEFLSDL